MIVSPITQLDKKAVLSQGGPRDAAVNFDNIELYNAITAVNYLSKSDKYLIL